MNPNSKSGNEPNVLIELNVSLVEREDKSFRKYVRTMTASAFTSESEKKYLHTDIKSATDITLENTELELTLFTHISDEKTRIILKGTPADFLYYYKKLVVMSEGNKWQYYLDKLSGDHCFVRMSRHQFEFFVEEIENKSASSDMRFYLEYAPSS